jgi:hypothetical protein
MNDSDDIEVKTENTASTTKIELTPQEIQQNKKQKRSKLRGEIRQILRGVFSFGALQLMLSHHPNCEIFDPHVFKIGKLRLCRGCFLSYPPLYAFVALFIFWIPSRDFFLSEAVSIIDNLWWFVIGFGILTFASRWIGRYSIFIKDVAKFSRGAWTGFLVIVLISQHWGFKIGAALIVIVGMSYLSLHRGKDMERTCDECEWSADFNSCPGWEGVAGKLFPVSTPVSENITLERTEKSTTENPELDEPDKKE